MSPYEAPGAFAVQGSEAFAMQPPARGMRHARIRPVRWDFDPGARMAADRHTVF